MYAVYEAAPSKYSEKQTSIEIARYLTHREADKAIADLYLAGRYDRYVERLADNSKPIGKRTTNRQAAPGNTQGSRHMIEGDVVVRETSGDPLRGPVVVAKGDWWLRHPEHAHMQFGAGVYQVRFQRDFAREERAAVQD